MAGKGANMAGANRESRNAVEWEIRMGNWYVGSGQRDTRKKSDKRHLCKENTKRIRPG